MNIGILDEKIKDCELSVRVQNICMWNNIETVRDLARLTLDDWLKFRNGGLRSGQDIERFLLKNGLSWGMNEEDMAIKKIPSYYVYEINRDVIVARNFEEAVIAYSRAHKGSCRNFEVKTLTEKAYLAKDCMSLEDTEDKQ